MGAGSNTSLVTCHSSQAALAARAAAQEAHFIRRVHERFGQKLTPQRYRLWVQRVEEVRHGTKFLGQCAERERTAWLIVVGGLRLRVIYDERTQCLVTALPYGDAQTAPLPRKTVQQLRGRVSDPDWRQKKRRMFAQRRWT